MTRNIFTSVGLLLLVSAQACTINDVDKGSAAESAPCTDETCVTQCEQEDEVLCEGVCIDPLADARFCGASGDCAGDNAGQDCGDGVCHDGQCGQTCDEGLIACAGACVDPLLDTRHCGATGSCSGDEAGTACAAGQVCNQGACAEDCPEGRLDCDGGCVNPRTSSARCGATDDCLGPNAGQVCNDDEVCAAGVCQCAEETIVCGDLCVDPRTNGEFCGASGDCEGPQRGANCPGEQPCINGACACPRGTSFCDLSCVTLQNDPQHCGECGQACEEGESCLDGVCVELSFAGALDPIGGFWGFFDDSGFDAAANFCDLNFPISTVCTAPMLDVLSETGQMVMAVGLNGEPVESFWAPVPAACDAWNHDSGTNGDEAAPLRELDRDTGRVAPKTGACGERHNIGCCRVRE